LSDSSNNGGAYRYWGRKFIQTVVGEALLLAGLWIGSKLQCDPRLYQYFSKAIVALVIGFGATNAAVSIGSFFKNGKP
jgi:hypothetical protein